MSRLYAYTYDRMKMTYRLAKLQGGKKTNMDQDKVYLFEDQPIRSAWVEDEEEWYFSIVDVVGVLTEQPDTDRARNYSERAGKPTVLTVG